MALGKENKCSGTFHVFIEGNTTCFCGKLHTIGIKDLVDKKYVKKLEDIVRLVVEEHLFKTENRGFLCKKEENCEICRILEEFFDGYRGRIDRKPKRRQESR